MPPITSYHLFSYPPISTHINPPASYPHIISSPIHPPTCIDSPAKLPAYYLLTCSPTYTHTSAFLLPSYHLFTYSPTYIYRSTSRPALVIPTGTHPPTDLHTLANLPPFPAITYPPTHPSTKSLISLFTKPASYLEVPMHEPNIMTESEWLDKFINVEATNRQ